VARLGANITGGADVSYGDDGGNGFPDLFNLSTPAGWAMFWWGLSVLIILTMFFSL